MSQHTFSEGATSALQEIFGVKKRTSVEQVREQITTVDRALEIFEEHRDQFRSLGYLSHDLVDVGLPPYGARLVSLFSDVPLEGEFLDIVISLQELESEKVTERWKTFLQEAIQIQEQLAPTPSLQWVIEGLGYNFFSAQGYRVGKGKKPYEGWKYFSEVPDLPRLAAWLMVEQALLSKQEIEEETPLHQEKEVVIAEGVSPQNVQRIFGERGAGILFDLLPEALSQVVKRIELIPPQIKEENATHDRDFKGKMDTKKGTMFLVMTDGLQAKDVVQAWLHELGHAFILGSDRKQQGQRRRFLQATTMRENITSEYARQAYQVLELRFGLEEDFAESFDFFFLDPETFRVQNPDRYKVMEELIQERLPDFDPTEVQRRVRQFIQEAEVGAN